MVLKKEQKQEIIDAYIKNAEVNLFRLEIELAALQKQEDIDTVTERKTSQETELQKLKDFKETLK